jgi:hypothetical protein
MPGSTKLRGRTSLGHRADGDAGSAGCDEPVLDVGRRRPCLPQKLLPAKAAIDVPLALALIGLGLVIVIARWLVPGLTPPTM